MSTQKKTEVTYKPDFNTDVLWRPMQKTRTMSTSSESSDTGTKRRTSITEMFLGNHTNTGLMGFMRRQSSIESDASEIGGHPEKSIAEEVLRRQRHILQDN